MMGQILHAFSTLTSVIFQIEDEDSRIRENYLQKQFWREQQIRSTFASAIVLTTTNEHVARAQQFYSAKNATFKSNQPNLFIQIDVDLS